MSKSIAPTARTTPTVGLHRVGKRYGGVPVLADISLEIPPGEIHGLLGENGAGKSTLLKILGGATMADSGTVTFDGVPTRLATPRDAISRGVSLISQELALVPGRSVLENVFLGRWANHRGIARPGSDLRCFRELLDATGFDLDPTTAVGTLPLGKAQQVEILKALARESRILCFDEPTAVLDEDDTENLLQVLRRLAGEGTTIILVSHFLEEVLSLADRVTVLRDGRLITTDDSARHTPDSLVRLMVGRELEALEQRPDPVPDDAPVVLSVTGLTNDRVHEVSFQVRAGEILGLAGLVGSGRSETLRAVFGADPVHAGTVSVWGRRLRHTIRAAIAAGVALVPQSRRDDGLVMGRGVRENVALGSLGRRQWAGLIDFHAERSAIWGAVAALDVRGAVHRVPVIALSGGNQQKVLFAKWMVGAPRVFLIDEPTRGVDTAAKAKIHGLILNLARSGAAVVVASSELEEVLALAHRIAVMRQGHVVAEFAAGADRQEVMSAAFTQEVADA